MGSIRHLTVGGKYLASGSTDERIKIFDLQKRTQEDTIVGHEGKIFFNTLHLTSFFLEEKNESFILKMKFLYDSFNKFSWNLY